MKKRQARSFNFLVPGVGLEEFSTPVKVEFLKSILTTFIPCQGLVSYNFRRICQIDVKLHVFTPMAIVKKQGFYRLKTRNDDTSVP
jgi:hypothetical protein